MGMEFIENAFRRFLEHNKIFYMIEQTSSGEKRIDMVIDDDRLRAILEKITYLEDFDSLSLTFSNNYDNTTFLKTALFRPEGRGANCLRMICDKYSADKINKISSAITHYRSEHPFV